MQTSYIYSVSRTNTLAQFLLSKTDIERLLVAEPGEDLQSALKETYLASYVLKVPHEDVALAVEQTLIDAKHLIHKIAPKSDMFKVLWVQYDVHNLRVLAKATAKNLTVNECRGYFTLRGIYQPELLQKHITEKTLSSLQPNWQEVFDRAVTLVTEGKIDLVDGIFDELYFETSQRIVDAVGDTFMKTYLSTLIDLYNIRSRLRHLKNPVVPFEPSFVSGGTFRVDQVETLDDVLAMLAKQGGVEYWKDALELFTETGNFTQLDAKVADRLLLVTKEASLDMFSSASLVLYYLKCRQAAANIRTIVVGKNSGMDIESIRSNLRLAYVNN